LYRYFWRFVQKADNVSLPIRAESLQFKPTKLRQYALAEKTRRWSDIVRHGGGVKPDGSGVGTNMGSDGRDGFFDTARRGRMVRGKRVFVHSNIFWTAEFALHRKVVLRNGMSYEKLRVRRDKYPN